MHQLPLMKIIQVNPGAGSFSFLLTNEKSSQNLHRPMRISLFFLCRSPSWAVTRTVAAWSSDCWKRRGRIIQLSPDQWEAFSKFTPTNGNKPFFLFRSPSWAVIRTVAAWSSDCWRRRGRTSGRPSCPRSLSSWSPSCRTSTATTSFSTSSVKNIWNYECYSMSFYKASYPSCHRGLRNPVNAVPFLIYLIFSNDYRPIEK